jgi:hypothetical protein
VTPDTDRRHAECVSSRRYRWRRMPNYGEGFPRYRLREENLAMAHWSQAGLTLFHSIQTRWRAHLKSCLYLVGSALCLGYRGSPKDTIDKGTGAQLLQRLCTQKCSPSSPPTTWNGSMAFASLGVGTSFRVGWFSLRRISQQPRRLTESYKVQRSRNSRLLPL